MRAVALALLLLTTASYRSEPSYLVVRVVGETTHRALPNAEVIDVETRLRRFTDDRGPRPP